MAGSDAVSADGAGVADRKSAARADGRLTEPTAEAGLPGAVAAAWGGRERPHKGPRPALSLPRIVAAAVRVADAEGLDAVSMGRVAAELGTAPMSLYRHVSAKDELLTLMADAAWGDVPDPGAPDAGWPSTAP